MKRLLRTAALTLGLSFLLCGTALALTLTIHFTVPRHLKPNTKFTVSGETSGYHGAEFFNIFYATSRCKSTETAESTLATISSDRKAGNLIAPADVQGPYSYTLTLGRYGRHATWLCAYLYQSAGNSRFHTQRVKALRIHT